MPVASSRDEQLATRIERNSPCLGLSATRRMPTGGAAKFTASLCQWAFVVWVQCLYHAQSDGTNARTWGREAALPKPLHARAMCGSGLGKHPW